MLGCADRSVLIIYIQPETTDVYNMLLPGMSPVFIFEHKFKAETSRVNTFK